MTITQIKQRVTREKAEFTFDAFTCTLISAKYTDIPCQFDDKNPQRSVVQLVEYLRQEISAFDSFTNEPTRPFNGYTRATAFIDTETGEKAFTLLYGGKSQNGSICVQGVGAYCNIVWPALTRHFEVKATRLDSAINYLGDYWRIQKILARLSITEPHHIGSEVGGHTHYFGSRTSPTMVRHYQYGKCHTPNLPATHKENRVEVEWKPHDKKHQLQAQELTAEQVFLRSRLGALFHGQMIKTLTQPVKLQSVKRLIETDLQEKMTKIAITYENTFTQVLRMYDGDPSQIGMQIIRALELHKERTKCA